MCIYYITFFYLWGTIFGDFFGSPVADICKTIYGGDEDVVFGEIAGVFVVEIGDIGLIDANGRSVVYPIFYERTVKFISSDRI